jgi:hypothetical protein
MQNETNFLLIHLFDIAVLSNVMLDLHDLRFKIVISILNLRYVSGWDIGWIDFNVTGLFKAIGCISLYYSYNFGLEYLSQHSD